MYYDEESSGLSFVAGLLLGAIIGAAAALLSAPRSGRKTRRGLRRQVSGVRDRASGHWEDLTDEVRSAVKAGRRRIRI
jgi:gas vesicle protein